MARYRKIDPRMWDDERFVRLSPTEKLIAVYAITAQSNRLGLFRFSPGLAVEQLGMDATTFAEGFRKVCQALRWSFDESRRVLYLPTWWKYNRPENPNVLRGALGDLHDLPQSPLQAEFEGNLRHLPQTLHKAFREGLAQPSPNQEQEQEQDKDQEQEPKQDVERGIFCGGPGEGQKNGGPSITERLRRKGVAR